MARHTLGATQVTIAGPDVTETLAAAVRADVDARIAAIAADLAHDYPGLEFVHGDRTYGGLVNCLGCGQPVTRHPDGLLVDADDIAACPAYRVGHDIP